MEFRANKAPVEVMKEGPFRGTYFGDICSSVTGKWYKNHGKNLIGWKILISSIIVQIIMMSVSINMMLNAEHRKKFWKIRVG